MSGETEAKQKLSAAERRKAREERQRAKEAEKAAKKAEWQEMIDSQIEDVEDIREELESKGENVQLLTYTTDHGVVAVRQPKAVVMARFRAEMNKQGKKRDLATATDVLVKDCLLYPDLQSYLKIVEKLPLLPESIGTDLFAAAGGGLEADVKKD